MLFSSPPGYTANSSNRQTLAGGPSALGSPGLQSQPVTPGTGLKSQSNLVPSGFQQSSPLASGTNPGTSSFATPSSQPSNMNQFFGSPNQSTLLRILLGKTT